MFDTNQNFKSAGVGHFDAGILNFSRYNELLYFVRVSLQVWLTTVASCTGFLDFYTNWLSLTSGTETDSRSSSMSNNNIVCKVTDKAEDLDGCVKGNNTRLICTARACKIGSWLFLGSEKISPRLDWTLDPCYTSYLCLLLKAGFLFTMHFLKRTSTEKLLTAISKRLIARCPSGIQQKQVLRMWSLSLSGL